MYAEEHSKIETAIGPWMEEIEHVGSTAVPGLAAKPVVDIMVGIRTLNDAPECVARLVEIGYEYVPEFEDVVPERRYFRKFDPEGRRTHQIHLVERTNLDWWVRHIAFRDYLRQNPEVAGEYGALKLDLSHRFRDDRAAYMDAKDEFVRSVEQRALLARDTFGEESRTCE